MIFIYNNSIRSKNNNHKANFSLIIKINLESIYQKTNNRMKEKKIII